jgi:hypothetical protein
VGGLATGDMESLGNAGCWRALQVINGWKALKRLGTQSRNIKMHVLSKSSLIAQWLEI